MEIVLGALLIAGFGALGLYLLVRTILACLPFRPWVLLSVVAIDLFVFGGAAFVLLLGSAAVAWILEGLQQAAIALEWGSLAGSLNRLLMESAEEPPSGAGDTSFVALPLLFVAWKMCLLFALARWEPVRGQGAAPRRPASGVTRGARRPRYREFPEPSPWQRGPLSY
ncbi:MAG: hypothetical protein ACK47B_01700 [Armatimonadota bacterium]